MNTSTFTVTLPESLRSVVEQAAGSLSPEAFIEGLILAEQQRQEDKRIEALLLEGIRSPLTPLTDDDLEEAFRRAMKRLDKDEDGIDVIRVLHAARDLPKILGP